ncbi:hypothetical protein [Pleionea sediminis]|uniref:hypothetical protein n=1 Tax=Pleionea sediminis TaxID=2569479 RepID=UPI0011859FC2|nr:hypothetical protein [Pleionea sediminis]
MKKINVLLSTKLLMTVLLSLFVSACGSLNQSSSSEYEHGKLRTNDNGRVEAFDESTNQWVAPREFWLNFADSHVGKFWGVRKDYPEYEQVNENDTLLIQLDKGECLMEFFHTRWRRAQDVRRWDDAFNEYSGCPFVFD